MKVLSVCVVAFTLLLSLPASSQDGYSLRANESRTGSRLRPVAYVGFPYPLDKPYEQFTVQEKDALKALYEPMAPEDEPPFPKEGMKRVFLAIKAAADKRRPRGTMTLVVHVNSAGVATNVDVLKATDAPFTQVSAKMFLVTEFKPAVCAGSPCAMQFPVSIEFSR